MRTARRYLALEIYRSCAVVLLALLGLFTFFALVDDLDGVGKRFTILAMFYMQALETPARLYDLLPIGLLIGAILALASLAQRNELVILRVSGVSGMRLLATLWLITVPLMAGALLLSEYITPKAETRYSEVSLALRGQSSDGRLQSGYWFKEPSPDKKGTRIINIKDLMGSGAVSGVTVYELAPDLELRMVAQAASGTLTGNGELTLSQVTETRIDPDASQALADARAPGRAPATVATEPQLVLHTTLNPERLLARVLTPERMSIASLVDYINYLHHNQLQADRQIVALWRKAVYPFTLLVMITIAAPISFMQTRRGGVGAKVFIGILLGVGFFMLNQLALNIGMLSHWPAWLTALGPNIGAMAMALAALSIMEYRMILSNLTTCRWPWKKSPA
ncbi:LPS export ABC transporter permease LptG [Bordetella sp. FB-8]|uniref:LPS export ABC transporter permease LptG n=1 Tax=Bordetella sp. FB-8 TaxID=1159870 RepID=UPI000362E1CC|nr:LPS export ABC transporter permease LptG [Bordetella sp. FB-8]